VVGDRNGPCERCSQSDPQPLHPCQRAGRELLPRPRRPAARRAGNAVQEPRPRPCKARSTRRPSRVPSSSRGSVRVGHRSRGSRRQDTIRQGHQPDHQIRVLALAVLSSDGSNRHLSEDHPSKLISRLAQAGGPDVMWSNASLVLLVLHLGSRRPVTVPLQGASSVTHFVDSSAGHRKEGLTL